MGGLFQNAIRLAIAAVLVAWAYGPVYHALTVLGVFRTSSRAIVAESVGLVKIEDTVHCEDLHHYQPANKLFAACEDTVSTRFGWFPPLLNFKQPPKSRGSIHVIDPNSMKSTRLSLEDDFSGPFSTHGIDVIQDPENVDAVYIFAVNHVPNPEYVEENNKQDDVPKARSQIELFHHVLESTTVKHIRSIRHPSIKTPNDIYADGPLSFYVTNDHFYREGILRTVEELIPAATWSNIIHVQIDNLDSSEADTGFQATEALTGLHNNNGLGHGQSADEMLITSAMSGYLYLARPSRDNNTLTITDAVAFDSVADNPSYYLDTYRTASDDASGYLVPGVARPIGLPTSHLDPSAKDGVMVWYLRRSSSSKDGWEKRLIFEDDGTNIRTASTAVLIPAEGEPAGHKKAWLFVTGFFAESIVAVPVDL